MNRRDLLISTAKAALATALGGSSAGSAAEAQSSQPAGGAPATAPLDRTILPIPEPKPPTTDVLDARNVIPPGRFEVKAPANAPNALIVLLDDMGFGQSSAFGGPIHMPALERLANEGLRYNQFHTRALCSPTRTALLTGRNHHMNNMGGITEVATAFPGNTGVRPNAIAPLAEILRLNGTAAFGKYHEAPASEISRVGPFDRWPTHSGFDKFYGFLGGEWAVGKASIGASGTGAAPLSPNTKISMPCDCRALLDRKGEQLIVAGAQVRISRTPIDGFTGYRRRRVNRASRDI
jgi:hypothetical protein